MSLVESENSSNAGRAIRLGGRRVTETELHSFVLSVIKKNNVRKIQDIAQHLGKSTKQTSRILKRMAELGKIEISSTSAKPVESTEQAKKELYDSLIQDDFNGLEEMKYYISECRVRGVKPRVLEQYCHALKRIFNFMNTRPRSVLPDAQMDDAPVTFGSKQTAITFAKNLMKKCQDEMGLDETPHQWRVSLRNLFDVYGLSFGHGMARQYGLGSHHTRFQPFAGAHIPLEVCQKVSSDMLADKNTRAYTWFNVGIMTGARTGGIATMVWERISFDESNFTVEQHETKDDAAGDVHLGEKGEWKKKFSPTALMKILTDWKTSGAPKNSRFLWFDDQGSDVLNRSKAHYIRERVIPEIRNYVMKYKSDLDAVSFECLQKEAGHLLRHTYAQLLKNAGMTDEQIALGNWKGTQTIAWYSSISKKDSEKLHTALNDIHTKKEVTEN